MKRVACIFVFGFIIFHSQSQDKWQQFNDYWFQGVAELASYDLKQSRYGEIHDGHAVLVFVTEPFSRSKQVKLDDPQSAGSDKISVLKLNLTKKFLTGIYPYSMMMSSFVPVSYDKYPDAIKVTASSQEWCGQTFTQLNLEGDEYEMKGFSYFESEGDFAFDIDNAWLEDELWQRIRIDPASLPLGSVRVFPGTLYNRLSHSDREVKTAVATMETVTGGEISEGPHSVYRLKYANRELSIHFESSFPYGILGWEEAYQGHRTWAKLKESITGPYWRQHNNEHRILRKQLRLDTE